MRGKWRRRPAVFFGAALTASAVIATGFPGTAAGQSAVSAERAQEAEEIQGEEKLQSPTSLKVRRLTKDSTTLQWEASDGALEYWIYWSDRNRTDLEGTEGYALAGKTKATTFVYEKPTHMERYFKVVAVDENGKSAPSEAVLAGIQKNFKPQAEYLNRGLTAVLTEQGVFASWRITADEYAAGAAYELYRDGCLIAQVSAGENSNYLDKEGTADASYTVRAVTGEIEQPPCRPVKVWSDQYLEVKLQKPEPYHDEKVTQEYEYTPNDTLTADADGDGQYELFVMWDGLSQDNSKDGCTAPVYIDCYKLDGTLLWRVDLGINIRAGAHYTQFQVYDFDGDGKAEMICKTADGTRDGAGKPIDGTEQVTDYRNETGRILSGPEYLTLFDGETGIALDTVDYDPQRGEVASWGDSYGNRVDRFLGCVAYLDGTHPSAVFSRGYYTRAVICAYDVSEDKLVQRWKIDSDDGGENRFLYNQGAHTMTAADVDNDGCQEVIFGSATVDHDGTLLYSLSEHGEKHGGHGDAERVGDFNLRHPGLEIFMVHENKPLDAGIEMHDGDDGNYVFSFPTTADIGRGAAADIDPRYEGAESWANNKSGSQAAPMVVSQDGTVISHAMPVANHTIWWDGDLGREILDHTFTNDNGFEPRSVYISKWDWEKEEEVRLLEKTDVYSINGTKGNPCFQADIFGDWREEAAWRTPEGNIGIYTTTDLSSCRLYTLMHDIQYRTQAASEATGYNQSPTPSFYIGFDQELMKIPVPTLSIPSADKGE